MVLAKDSRSWVRTIERLRQSAALAGPDASSRAERARLAAANATVAPEKPVAGVYAAALW